MVDNPRGTVDERTCVGVMRLDSCLIRGNKYRNGVMCAGTKPSSWAPDSARRRPVLGGEARTCVTEESRSGGFRSSKDRSGTFLFMKILMLL